MPVETECPADGTLYPGIPQNKGSHVNDEQRAEFDQLKPSGNFQILSGKRASGQSNPDTDLGCEGN